MLDVIRWSTPKEVFQYEDYNVLSCFVQPVSQDIFQDIEDVKKLSKAAYENIKNEADYHIGVKVFHLLIADILGTFSVPAKIFQNKVNHDFPTSFVVTLVAKNLACCALVMYNICVAVLSTLLIGGHSNTWQSAFVTACVVQFVLEGVYTTNDCILWHYALPSFILEDLRLSIRTMVINMDHALACTALWRKKKRKIPSFEATSYFFVSRQVAAKCPHIFECSMVLAFMSMFPRGKLAQHFKTTEAILVDTYMGWVAHTMKKVHLTALVSKLVDVLSHLPVFVQVILLRSVQPLVLYLMLLLAILTSNNIVLLCIPFFIVAYIILCGVVVPHNRPTMVPPIVYKSMEVDADDGDDSSDSDADTDKLGLDSDSKRKMVGDGVQKKSDTINEKENVCAPTTVSPKKKKKKKKKGKEKKKEKEKKEMEMEKEMNSKSNGLSGKAKAHQLAIEQYNQLGMEESNKPLLSGVDSPAVERIANLIAESSGVPMEMARRLAKSKLQKEMEQTTSTNDYTYSHGQSTLPLTAYHTQKLQQQQQQLQQEKQQQQKQQKPKQKQQSKPIGSTGSGHSSSYIYSSHASPSSSSPSPSPSSWSNGRNAPLPRSIHGVVVDEDDDEEEDDSDGDDYSSEDEGDYSPLLIRRVSPT